MQRNVHENISILEDDENKLLGNVEVRLPKKQDQILE
jgi:hypothetical protein